MLTFAGNLTVQGTMTTLDTKVTEVDQLEVAANNTTVGVAITQSGTGDILNLYDGSTEVFSVADGGNVTITDSIIHSDDTNTKIRFPANDTFSVETAGSERLNLTASRLSLGTNIRVNDYVSHQSNDSLGIKFYNGSGNSKYLGLGAEDDGTSTSHKTFKIMKQGSSVTRLVLDTAGNFKFDGADFVINDAMVHNNDPNTKIRFPADDTIAFETAGGERLKIDSGGQLIHSSVSTQSADFGTGAAGGAFHKYDLGSAGATIGYLGSANNLVTSGNVADFVLRSQGNMILASGGGTERVRITSTGLVSIGETNPSSDVTFTFRKDIAAASGNATMQIRNLYQGTSGQSNQSGAEIEFIFKNHNAAHNYWGGRILCDNSDNYNQYTSLQFHTASQGNAVERMRLAHDGDLTIFGKDNAELKLKCGTTTGNNIIAFQNSGGTTRGNIAYDSDNNFLLFNVNQGERARITSDGEMLLGTGGADRPIAAQKFNSASGWSGTLQIEKPNPNNGNNSVPIVAITAFNGANEQYTGGISFNRSNSNTQGTQGAVNTNQQLGNIAFNGSDGTNFIQGAEIFAIPDQTFATNDGPTSLVFATTPDGTSEDEPQERLRIASNGAVCVGSGYKSGGGGHLTIRGGGINTYACQDYQYVGTPSNTNTLAQIRFTANTSGASVIQGAKIQAVADADWSATGDAPTRLEFHTAADGSASLGRKLWIDSNAAYLQGLNHTSFQVRSGSGNVIGTLQTVQDVEVRLGCNTNHPLAIYAGTLERLRIGSSGEIHLGTTNWPTGSIGKSAGRVVIGNEGSLTIWNETNSAGGGGTVKLACKEGSNATRVGFVNVVGGTENTSDRSGFFKIEVSNSSGSGIERLRIASDGQLTHNYDIGSNGDAALILNTDDASKASSILFRANNESRARIDVQRLAGDGAQLKIQVSQMNNSNTMLDAMTIAPVSSGDTTPDVTLTGNLKLASGNGIDFSSNTDGGETSTFTTLEDYEEGTFTPHFEIESRGAEDSPVDGVQARYVKVGNVVTCHYMISCNGTPSERSTSRAWEIHGFPYQAKDGNSSGQMGGSQRVTGYETATYGPDGYFVLRLFNNTTYGRLEFIESNYNGTRNASTMMQNNAQVIGTITYQTDG